MLRLVVSLAAAWLALALPSVAGEPAQGAAPAPAMEQDARCLQFVASAHVNGRPARLMVDTGATHTVLAADFAARQLPGLERLEGVQLVGNAQQAPVPALASVQVGGQDMGKTLVLVMPLDGVNSMLEKPVDGILGMSHLGRLGFVLDLRSGKGYWAETPADEPEGCTVALPLRGQRDAAGRLLLLARSAGQACRLLLDSGSSSTSWPEGKWEAGAVQGGEQRVADVNGARDAGYARGLPAPLELGGGLLLPGVSPLLQPGGNSHVLGLDALKGCLLIHRPGQGFFLLPPGEPEQEKNGQNKVKEHATLFPHRGFTQTAVCQESM